MSSLTPVSRRRRVALTATLGAALTAALVPFATSAHSPSVSDGEPSSPEQAIVLEDPTLSRAIGAVLKTPGEVDWYRMDLEAGDPLVLGMTAPDAAGAVAATFTLLGPGLPDASSSGPGAQALAEATGVSGALTFEPDTEPSLEVHAGLGFTNFGTIRMETPETASYWVAVSAVDPETTGKYVFAPGLREEFGVDAIGGLVDLIDFFNAPWPPVAGSETDPD